ncbi:hypothetical protein [Agrococcus jejuensis]|uniref:ABC-2 family transporter protein n=1 Tax=Agrococcus jejuensis TaxID=399736 RepID=A0A1G8EA68_9MICO|nr:hypothetical protein [Agrococcus jejuensis]SDH66764.1 hypothetical protein SAMN04489720_1949 [Agrococcus jejuensis]
MFRTASVIRLHTQQRFNTFVLPFIILGIALAVVLAIGVIANLSVDDPSELDGMHQGMQWNGAVFSVLGPLMGFGFTAMLQIFPLSLGLGITRREFAAGTLAVFGIIAAFFTTAITILKSIEQATDGFGLRIRMFDVVYVGTGDWWQTAVQTFLLLLMAMFLGAAVSTVYLRWGQRGLWIALTSLALVPFLLVSIALVVPGMMEQVFIALGSVPWIGWMGIVAVVAVLAAGAWVLLIRRAPVR